MNDIVEKSLAEDYHLLSYNEIDSTNNEAKRIAERNGMHGAFIWAKLQKSGKGRIGREWISNKGNFFTSILLSPTAPLASLTALSFVTAVAVYDAISPIISDYGKISLKWPNDILLNDKKLGGILLESFEIKGKRWLIIGVGINVDSSPEIEDILYPATSLKDAGVEIISAKIVLSRFIHHFILRYDEWIKDGFSPARKKWLKFAHKIGKEIIVRSEIEEIKGIFTNIDEYGNLLFKVNGKIRKINSGDVIVG